MRKIKFQLFQCCAIVEGYKQGIIFDFQRKQFHIFPNNILKLFRIYSKKQIHFLFIDFQQSKVMLKRYIRYFIKNELVHFDNNLKYFKPVLNDFIKPFKLDTLSIEIGNTNKSLNNFLNIKIDELGLNSLKLIIEELDIKILISILDFINHSKIQHIAIFINYDENHLNKLNNLLKKYKRINEIIFFNSSNIEKCNVDKIYFDNLDLNNVLFKRINSINDFTLNIDAYLESKKYNLIYNRTLHINQNGQIKKHIKDIEILGNLTNINSILENKNLIDFWSISKDKIEICKDCEFRYVCPDGRIPIKKNVTDKFYTHTEDCKYNPYESTWT